MLHIDHSFANRNLNEGFSGGEKKRFELVADDAFEAESCHS